MNIPKTAIDVKRRILIRRRIDLLVVGTLLLAVIGIGIFEVSNFRVVRDKIKERATRAALSEASAFSNSLSARLLDLGVMASLFPDGMSRSIPPDPATQRTIRVFIALHPSLVDLELFRPRDGAILWSTRVGSKAVSSQIPHDLKATPLPSNPVFVIGTSRFSQTLGIRILPISYIQSGIRKKGTLGFRTNLRIPDFFSGSTHSPWNVSLKDLRTGNNLFVSRGSRTPSKDNVVQVSVRDYPFSVQIYWPQSLVWQEWKKNAGLRWALGTARLLFLVFLGWGIRTLVRRQEKQAEELSDLSSLNEAFFEGAGAIGIVIDRSGEIIRINRAARDFMGVTFEDIQGSPNFWERFFPPEFCTLIRTLFDQTGHEPVPLHHESFLMNPKGSQRIFDWTNTVLRDSDGHPLYLVSLGFDVTERRNLEKSLEEQNQRLERLLAFDVLRGRVAEAVAKATEDGKILSEFCRLAMEVPEIRLVWLGCPDETGTYKMLARAGEVGYLDDVVISSRADLPEGRGPAGQTWREGVSVYNPSYSHNPDMLPWRERAEHFGIASSATLPVRRDGKVWAVLTVYLDREEPFDSGLRLLLEAIAENLSLALDRIDLASRERYATLLKESLLSNTSAGIVLVRYPERIVVEANRSFLEILGHDPSENIVGKRIQELYSVREDSIGQIEEGVDRALQEGFILLRDLQYLKPDGQKGYVDLSGHKLEKGEGDTIVWTLIDVTERHLLAQNIVRLSDFNALLAQVNQAIADAPDETGLLQTVCDLAVRYGKLRLAWIGQPKENGVIRFFARSGETRFLDGLEISVNPSHPHGIGAVEKVWRTGQPLFDFNLLEAYVDTPIVKRFLQYSILSAAVLPVVREGRVWGLLALYLEEANRFDHPLQEVLSELSRDVSRGLDRLESLRREREWAALQKVLLGNTLAGIVLLENRQFRFVNNRLLQMFGYERADDLMGQSTRMLYKNTLEFDRVGFAYDLLSLRENVEVSDVAMVKKDGSPMIVDLSITRIPGEASVVGTFHDVTDRHAQTEKLRLLSSYNTLLARAGELITSTSSEATLFQRLCDMIVRYGGMGMAIVARPGPQGEIHLVGSAGEISLPASMLDSFGRDLLIKVLEGREPVFLNDRTPESPLATENGMTEKIHARAGLPIFRKGEIWGVLAIGHREKGSFDDPILEGLLIELTRNISNALARLDLLSRQKLLSNAVEAVGEGVVITDPSGRVVFVNSGFTAITGYSAEEMQGKNCRILQGPETDPATVDAIRTAIRQGSSFHGQILNYRKNKTLFWNLLSISPIRDEEGKIVEFVGNQREVTALIDLNRRLEYESRHDRLTGLPNRRALDLELTKAVARSTRYQWPLAVGIIDLDGFKPVNDQFGHEAGDRLLRELGGRISKVLRKTDFVARLGGDEFVLVIENYSGSAELEDLMDRIDHAVRTPVDLENFGLVSVGVSMGVALHTPGIADDNPDLLLRSADHALYESKAHKGDRSRSWMIQGENLPLVRNHAQQLLVDGRVDVHYQPVLSADTGRIAGIEALARLKEPDGRLLFPGTFLPMFNDGDLFELSRQVLERSMADFPSLLESFPELWLSVNVDPRSVSEVCIDCLKRMLEENEMDPSHLILEILEGQEFGETIVAIELLERLKELGVRLALDDLGSAYSSLLRLKDLPVDNVKLDQEFVRTLASRPKDLHFVEAIMELSHRMGLRLTVEGVETEDIMDGVWMLGVDFLQGYALSRPLPFDDLKVFLRDFVPEKREVPKSLFGLYALSVRIHGTQRNLLIQSPHVLNDDALGDNFHCPLRPMMESLGFEKDSDIVLRHARYHEALGEARKRAEGNRFPLVEADLYESDRILEGLTEAILKEEKSRKLKEKGLG